MHFLQIMSRFTPQSLRRPRVASESELNTWELLGPTCWMDAPATPQSASSSLSHTTSSLEGGSSASASSSSSSASDQYAWEVLSPADWIPHNLFSGIEERPSILPFTGVTVKLDGPIDVFLNDIPKWDIFSNEFIPPEKYLEIKQELSDLPRQLGLLLRETNAAENYLASLRCFQLVGDPVTQASAATRQPHVAKYLRYMKLLMSQHEGFRRAYQRVLSPVRQLPDPILSQIFQAASHLRPDSWWRNISGSEVPQPRVLSMVCRRWRKLARATPTLWNQIAIISGRPSRRTTERSLRLSAQAPLDVYIETSAFAVEEDDGEWEGLLENSTRWRNVTLNIPDPHLIPSSLEHALLHGNFPSMRRLSISCHPTAMAATLRWFITAPHLKHVELRGLRPADIFLPWIQLKTLKLRTPIPLSACLDLFKSTALPYLQQCNISISEVDVEGPPTRFALPSLDSLTLHGHWNLISHLSIPKLTSLYLCDMTIPNSRLSLAISAARAWRLRRLHIQSIEADTVDLSDLLCDLNMLRELSISDMDDSYPTLFQELMRSAHQTSPTNHGRPADSELHILPDLEHIVLASNQDFWSWRSIVPWLYTRFSPQNHLKLVSLIGKRILCERDEKPMYDADIEDLRELGEIDIRTMQWNEEDAGQSPRNLYFNL
ncbi:hypothetical protein ONZ45_g8248 [Pleurotus djamor]|nr:hypothetical protein ONZ45_g8248 [Pleurotus djamor]